MNQRMCGLTAEKLEELAKDPSNVVMQPTYTHHQMWNADIIDTVFQKFFDNTASEDDEMIRDFKRDHPLLYDKLSDPEFLKRKGCKTMLKYMLKELYEVQSGKDTAKVMSEVSDMALKTVL